MAQVDLVENHHIYLLGASKANISKFWFSLFVMLSRHLTVCSMMLEKVL